MLRSPLPMNARFGEGAQNDPEPPLFISICNHYR
jgi:hypothetical protein